MAVSEDGIGTVRVTDGNSFIAGGGSSASVRSTGVRQDSINEIAFHGAVGGVSSQNAVLGHAAADVVNGGTSSAYSRSICVIQNISNRNTVGGTVFQGVGGGGAVGHGHLVGIGERSNGGGHVVQGTELGIPGVVVGFVGIGSGGDQSLAVERSGGGHVVVFVSVHGEDGAELLQVAGAADGAGFGTGLVQGRQKHAGEDGDDGDNHRYLQFNPVCLGLEKSECFLRSS